MMKKMALVVMMALTLSLGFNATAFAGMNNSTSEIFDDELPSIDIQEVETVPETEPETEPETKAPETEPETETVPETVPETEAPTKESKEESKEETTTAAPETKPVETTAPETEAPSRDYTPETSGRVIRHHRNVVICDNEPIPTTEAETKVIEATRMDEPETETETETVPETEKIPVPQPRLPKTADMSTVMGGIVAALAVTGAALGVVANRKKKEQ